MGHNWTVYRQGHTIRVRACEKCIPVRYTLVTCMPVIFGEYEVRTKAPSIRVHDPGELENVVSRG